MTSPTASRSVRPRAVLKAAERDGVRLWCRAKLLAYGAIALWLVVEQGWPQNAWYLGAILVFVVMAVSLIALSHCRWYRDWISFAYAAVESVLCIVVLTTQNPLMPHDMTLTDVLRFSPTTYLFVFLASTALTLAPWLVICAGSVAACGWIAAVLLVVAIDDSAFTAPPAAAAGAAEMAFVYDPHFVDLRRHIDETLVILVVTGLLAAAVWRARHLMIARIGSERARANLARYFAPALVDELARASHSLTKIAEHDIAVLFVDIIGFTRRCEGMGGHATMQFLREFHLRMDAAVFEHGGTLDKYIGDAVMATFGTPRAGERDAANALACALAIQAVVQDWNRSLVASGAAPLRVGVGVHYGPVVMGDIGGEQRLEYAVIGDTVNVAARLEQLTRSLNAEIVISRDLAEAARAEGANDLLAGFQAGEEVQLAGRAAPIAILHRPRQDHPADVAAE